MTKLNNSKNKWSDTDEATLMYTLGSKKAKSNWGDNGPKNVA
jgi:hypothetical protein